MSIDKILVNQKAKKIIEEVQKLSALLKKTTYEEFVTDELSCTIAERRLERIINRAIDINFHLIRALNQAPPEDYTDSFLKLGELDIITSKLAKNIAPAAGTRNVLTHAYDDLDMTRFYSALQDAVKLFPKYIKQIEQFL